MPANKKTFDLTGDGIFELSTENEASKDQKGCYDGKWLEESKAKLLKQIDDEKRTNLITSSEQNQMTKHYINGIWFF